MLKEIRHFSGCCLIEHEKKDKAKATGKPGKGRGRRWEVVGSKGQTPEKRLEAAPPVSPSRTDRADRPEAAPAPVHAPGRSALLELRRGTCYFSAWPTSSQGSLTLISPFWASSSLYNKAS